MFKSIVGKMRDFSNETGWQFTATYSPRHKLWLVAVFDVTDTQKAQTQDRNWYFAHRAAYNIARDLYDAVWKSYEESRPVS